MVERSMFELLHIDPKLFAAEGFAVCRHPQWASQEIFWHKFNLKQVNFALVSSHLGDLIRKELYPIGGIGKFLPHGTIALNCNFPLTDS